MDVFRLHRLWHRSSSTRRGSVWARPRLEALEDRVVPATPIDLGTLGGLSSQALAFNAAGQVVGGALTTSGDMHAFLYDGGSLLDLGTLGGTTSVATGINPAGQVVGMATDAGESGTAFLEIGGAMISLGTLGGPASYANAISAGGEIVGFADLPPDASGLSAYHAFLFSHGGMMDLGTLGGFDSNATAISASGDVVGSAQTPTGTFHGFLYSGGVMTDLGTLSGVGGLDSYATGMNDMGEVVGYANTSMGTPHAFLWSRGVMNDIGADYQPTAIDAEGDVVGSGVIDASGTQHAMVYHHLNGTWMDLNNYLPSGSNWVLQSATAVNDLGQVVGMGLYNGVQHAYLMTLPQFILSRPTLTVTTSESLNSSATTFGPYVPGLTLNVPFSVTLSNDPSFAVASVRWSVDGGSWVTARPGAVPGAWRFAYNVGALAAGTHALTVAAYDAAGQPLPGVVFRATFAVQSLPVTFSLDAEPNGANPVPAGSLRFLQSVHLSTTFVGTVNGLPSYYQNSPMQVLLGSQPVAFLPMNLGGPLGFQFTIDAGTLPAGTTWVSVHIGSVGLRALGTSPLPVEAVAEPGWLSGAVVSFDGQHQAYDFTHVRPTVQLTAGASPVPTHLAWLDQKLHGQATGVTLTPDMAVTVPLDPSQSPTFTVNSLHVVGQALGRTVWNQTYTAAQLTVGGQLDPQTVTPQGLTIQLAQPTVLGPTTLLKRQFNVSYPVSAPLKKVAATVGLLLSASSMTADAGLALDWQNNHAVLDPTGTFFQLAATATATGNAAATATVVKGWRGKYSAQAFVQLALGLSGTARFGGTRTAPQLDPTSDFHVNLGGSYGYTVTGHQAGTGNPVNVSNTSALGPFVLI